MYLQQFDIWHGDRPCAPKSPLPCEDLFKAEDRAFLNRLQFVRIGPGIIADLPRVKSHREPVVKVDFNAGVQLDHAVYKYVDVIGWRFHFEHWHTG